MTGASTAFDLEYMRTKLSWASGIAVAATFLTALGGATGPGAAAEDIASGDVRNGPATQFTSEPVVQALPAASVEAQPAAPDGEAASAATIDARSLADLAAVQPQPGELSSQLHCLAGAIYFEARGETAAGQYAVAEVTMNRVASGRYPATVCGVVHQKNWDSLRKRYVSAFSWNELDERPSPEDETFRRAWEVAETVYYGRHTPTLGGALHYHATHIKPSWARGNKPVARIGKHIFYR